MPVVFWDAETFSRRELKKCGAHIYATDPSTGIHFLCYAVDDGEVQTWRSGDPVPAPFADPAGHLFITDNWTFERAILEYVLIPRYGFAPIPIENQDCAQRRALASAYPAELGLRCEALGLPYRKDPAARKAMLRLSRLEHKYRRPEDRERDLALLHTRGKIDVESTRAAYNHPRLRPPSPEERRLLLLDAEINARGIRANVPFLEAVFALATEARAAGNARLGELTAGAISSVDQIAKIKNTVNAHGHAMTTLGKRSVSAVLAHGPGDFVRELLTLRQRGAPKAGQTAERLLAHADPGDARVRNALRIYGSATGRWSSPGAQLHNLPRNDAEFPAHLVDALVAGDLAELARHGDPLAVVGQLMRAALCAKPGHVLICVDFATIESRVWRGTPARPGSSTRFGNTTRPATSGCTPTARSRHRCCARASTTFAKPSARWARAPNWPAASADRSGHGDASPATTTFAPMQR